MKVELDDIRTQLEHSSKTRVISCRFPFIVLYKYSLHYCSSYY